MPVRKESWRRHWIFGLRGSADNRASQNPRMDQIPRTAFAKIARLKPHGLSTIQYSGALKRDDGVLGRIEHHVIAMAQQVRLHRKTEAACAGNLRSDLVQLRIRRTRGAGRAFAAIEPTRKPAVT
jgi:hypothetical protein